MSELMTHTTKLVELLIESKADYTKSDQETLVMITFDAPKEPKEDFNERLAELIEEAKQESGCEGGIMQRNGRFVFRLWKP